MFVLLFTSFELLQMQRIFVLFLFLWKFVVVDFTFKSRLVDK